MHKFFVLVLFFASSAFASPNHNTQTCRFSAADGSYEACVSLPNGDIRVEIPRIVMDDGTIFRYSAANTDPNAYCNAIFQMRRHVQMEKEFSANRGRIGIAANGDITFLDQFLADDVVKWIVCTNRP